MSDAAHFSAAFGHSRSQLDGLKNVLRLSVQAIDGSTHLDFLFRNGAATRHCGSALNLCLAAVRE